MNNALEFTVNPLTNLKADGREGQNLEISQTELIKKNFLKLRIPEMKTENIKEIIVNDKNELLLKLGGSGNPMYQYIYREAAGVYWDNSQKAFKSTPLIEWTESRWFIHIKDIVESGLNIELIVDENVKWSNLTYKEIIKIKNALQN
jgi:hypothetical protein